MGQDDVGGERDQFRRVFAHIVSIGAGPTAIDPDVLADGPTQLPETLEKCGEAGLCFRIVRGQAHEHADTPHPTLMCARDERPRGHRAAKKRDTL